MTQDSPDNAYFVFSAHTIVQWSYDFMRVDPKRVIICGSTLSRIKSDPLSLLATKEIDKVVAKLVSLGATVLGDPNKGMFLRMPGAAVLFDRRPELDKFSSLPENKQKQFYIVDRRVRRHNEPFERFNASDLKFHKVYDDDKSNRDVFVKLWSALDEGRWTVGWLIYFQITFGILAAVSAPALLQLILFVVSKYSPLVVWVMALVGGAILFAWREKARLSYGTAELIMGIATVSNTIDLPKAIDDPFQNVAYLQAAAGLYVTVRGFDNIGKGIEGTRFAPIWKRIFESKPRGA